MMHLFRTALGAALIAGTALTSAPAPARANTTSTILIGAAAAAAAFTAINVTNKNKKANTLVGYMPNGNPVYADGHVQLRNGQKYYPGNHGQTLACQSQRCTVVGTNGYYNGQNYNH